MSKRLDNKTAIITGGAGGIGSAAGKIFCEEGAKVALIDVSEAAITEAITKIREKVPNATVHGIVADIGIESEAGRVIEEVVKLWDRLDILVNNVGIRRYEAVADAPWKLWDDIVRVNLLSVSSLSRAALPYLRRSGHGSIVNTSTTYALHGRKGMGAYDATKAGVLALTRTLAHEEASYNVRVNAICPGFTRTPFHIKRLGENVVNELVPPCALKRWAEPSEMAYPMLWLASDEASYVTGATFMIDGGQPA